MADLRTPRFLGGVDRTPRRYGAARHKAELKRPASTRTCVKGWWMLAPWRSMKDNKKQPFGSGCTTPLTATLQRKRQVHGVDSSVSLTRSAEDGQTRCWVSLFKSIYYSEPCSEFVGDTPCWREEKEKKKKKNPRLKPYDSTQEAMKARWLETVAAPSPASAFLFSAPALCPRREISACASPLS
ncbi:hypothetical protein BD289DRAFT_282866 [Coniella lustricola]|uniref:Uncharacterized protein n=1 Tax=Coniella lustricola TaxID=2025994 RepID=A0A2T3A5V4_9PEZI|nr:hypothetical protein BD289DRAFT_282866 [Coniella lustricola]